MRADDHDRPSVSRPPDGRALFDSLANATDAIIGVTDLDANVLWVSEALVGMTGYTLDDYRFQRFENPYIPAEDVAVVTEFLGAFLASEVRLSGVVRNRFVDRWGGTLHVRSRIAKVDWHGRAALLYSIVPEDPVGEQPLEVEQRYRSLVEAATDSIVRLRPDLTFQFSNRCFQELLARPPVELNTLSFGELVHPDHRASVVAALDTGEAHFQVVIPLLDHAGNTLWLDATFVRFTDGADAGLLQAVMRDTTRRRRLEARVQTAQKREGLGQLAGRVAHDLNNILTGILGTASLAERDLQPGPRLGQVLADIRLAAERAGELASSMLAYAGEGNAERLGIDLGQLVAEMRPLLGAALQENVRLRVDVPADALVIVADETQIRQVVLNLITNAADAMPDGGEVRVECGTRELPFAQSANASIFGATLPAGSAAFIRVVDRGSGMSQDTMERIFDPFFSTKEKGRGLGLAAVLGTLDRHGGCVRVQSEPGEGTRFEVVLPLSSAPLERATPKPVDDALAVRQGLILVVDDQAALRRLIRRMLVPVGYDVMEAASGEVALEILERSDITVCGIVLDEKMPGICGSLTLARVHARFPTMPVVRMSGNSADFDLPGSAQAPVRFLRKPFAVSQLVDAVRDVLGGSRLR